MKYQNSKSTKVSFLPYCMAGHPLELSHSIAKLGFETKIWILEESRFSFGGAVSIFGPNDRFLRRETKRWKTFVQVLRWSDVIHCTFGSTLAGNTGYVENEGSLRSFMRSGLIGYENLFFTIELFLYRLFKKKMIVDYQGDDIRQMKYQLENYEHSIAQSVPAGYYTERNDSRKRDRLEKFVKYGFSINALNPDLLNYLPLNAKFVPYSNVNIDTRTSTQITSNKFSENPLVFVHAPSNRFVKGSARIQQIFEELKSEGYRIELKLVENLENSEALTIYKEAFMAIDQLNAGWYGGFAVECMSFGTPVISYIRASDLSAIPVSMKNELPILEACSCNLREVVIGAARMRIEEYAELSSKSMGFVHKWHNPDVIASEIVRSYR